MSFRGPPRNLSGFLRRKIPRSEDSARNDICPFILLTTNLGEGAGERGGEKLKTLTNCQVVRTAGKDEWQEEGEGDGDEMPPQVAAAEQVEP